MPKTQPGLPRPAPGALARCAATLSLAVNDNDHLDPTGAALLRAAQRLFARNGAAAAEVAQEHAASAFFAADRAGTRWWLAVIRLLDQMAAAEPAGARSLLPAPSPAGAGGHLRRH